MFAEEHAATRAGVVPVAAVFAVTDGMVIAPVPVATAAVYPGMTSMQSESSCREVIAVLPGDPTVNVVTNCALFVAVTGVVLPAALAMGLAEGQMMPRPLGQVHASPDANVPVVVEPHTPPPVKVAPAAVAVRKVASKAKTPQRAFTFIFCRRRFEVWFE